MPARDLNKVCPASFGRFSSETIFQQLFASKQKLFASRPRGMASAFLAFEMMALFAATQDFDPVWLPAWTTCRNLRRKAARALTGMVAGILREAEAAQAVDDRVILTRVFDSGREYVPEPRGVPVWPDYRFLQQEGVVLPNFVDILESHFCEVSWRKLADEYVHEDGSGCLEASSNCRAKGTCFFRSPSSRSCTRLREVRPVTTMVTSRILTLNPGIL